MIADAEVAEPQGGVPPMLLCSMCGQQYVSVLVSWLESGTCEQLCGGCYLATAAATLKAVIDANPD